MRVSVCPAASVRSPDLFLISLRLGPPPESLFRITSAKWRIHSAPEIPLPSADSRCFHEETRSSKYNSELSSMDAGLCRNSGGFRSSIGSRQACYKRNRLLVIFCIEGFILQFAYVMQGAASNSWPTQRLQQNCQIRLWNSTACPAPTSCGEGHPTPALASRFPTCGPVAVAGEVATEIRKLVSIAMWKG